MHLLPCWLLSKVLSPARNGRLVAPFEQFWHDGAVCAGHHEGLHSGLVAPERACPEGVVSFAQYADGKIALGPPRLQRRPECRDEECREVSPRPHAQTRNRDQRHGSSPTCSPVESHLAIQHGPLIWQKAYALSRARSAPCWMRGRGRSKAQANGKVAPT